MKSLRIQIHTNGEKAYSITQEITKALGSLPEGFSGMLFIFCQHTSCGLCINESFDPLATQDLEEFLRYLAPRNLPFIQHTDEGADDSPSHMKTLFSGSSLTIPIESGKMLLGTWQGINLLEFRDQPKVRQIILKILEG